MSTRYKYGLQLWGDNSYGQLGDNTTTNRSVPTQVIGSDKEPPFNSVSGNYTTSGIKTDGTLWTWGNNLLGTIGDNTTTNKSSPVQTIAGGNNWKRVSCGDVHIAAIKTDGTLWTWGNNSYGQLGDNTVTHRSSPVQTVSGGNNWKQVDSSVSRPWVNAIKTDGTLWSWGDNFYGQLGDGTITNRSSPVQTVSGGNNWKQVSSGLFCAAALKTDGTLWAWGWNGNGEVGDGTTTNRSSPVQVVGTNKWVLSLDGNDSVFSNFGVSYTEYNDDHTGFKVRRTPTLWRWGYNLYGGVGDGTITHRNSPVQIYNNADASGWRQMAYGIYNTSAIKTDGTLWTWGFNDYGTVGSGVFTQTGILIPSPTQIAGGGTNWSQVSCGDYHVGAIKTDGTLWSWGYNLYGHLGNNSSTNLASPVQTVCGGNDWKQVSYGRQISSAIKTDGTLWTWGYGITGALGDNTSTLRSSPVQTVSGGTTWKFVCASRQHVTAIKTDGTLWTWGCNLYAGLGDGTLTDRSSPIQTIAGGTTWKQVSTGYIDNVAAIKTDGTLWCWGGGSTYGETGNNSLYPTYAQSPVQTSLGGTTWKYATCGYYCVRALKADGTLWTWGSNSYGQLGDLTFTHRSTPVQINSFPSNNWIVSPNYDEANPIDADIGLRDDTLVGSVLDYDDIYVRKEVFMEGNMWAMGYGPNVQLGNNSTQTFSSPIQVIGTDWRTISNGLYNAGSIRSNGTLWMWGYNSYGGVGNNSTNTIWSPIQVAVGNTWKKVSTGYHTAAIRSDGSLWCWGNNTFGECGQGNYSNRLVPTETYIQGADWRDVGACNGWTLGLKTNGSLYAWGLNNVGQLGVATTTTMRYMPTEILTGTRDWKAIATTMMGYNSHGAAIKTDGTLWCWGDGTYGQLGNNSLAHQSSPVQTTAGGTDWKQVSCGQIHTGAIKTDGTLWCWGYNVEGACGNNSTTSAVTPVQTITGGTGWKQVSCGYRNSYAVKTDGTLWGWGSNSWGQVGLAITTPVVAIPRQLSTETTWRTVSGGYCVMHALKNTD